MLCAFTRADTKVWRRILLHFVVLPMLIFGADTVIHAQTYIRDYEWRDTINEAVITVKVPKRLRTSDPFWGVPVPKSLSDSEPYECTDSFAYYRPDTTKIPRWICWNLDLATMGSDRYKYEKLFPQGLTIPSIGVLRRAVLECYKWAWRKPYGNTCVVLMPLYNNRSIAVAVDKRLPYAFVVAVCKQERLKVPMPLGFTSTAFLIPLNASGQNIYDYSISVNAAEAHSHYDLFSKLPASVQEQVEELTDYEILCPYQETDQAMLDQFMPELERGDFADDPMHEVD